ncbi:MAG: hypothetical protein QW171_00155 [Candidatus Bilamarchaeaceae archaeon]
MKRCISCGRNAKKFVEFPCPKCDRKIIRCNFCRENRVKYECECGFTGP